jgi:hypothetical protein
MYTNQQASQVQQPITHYTKKCNTHTFMDILNSPEYTDKIETLFPAQRVRLFSPKLTVSMFMAHALNEDRSWCKNCR